MYWITLSLEISARILKIGSNLVAKQLIKKLRKYFTKVLLVDSTQSLSAFIISRSVNPRRRETGVRPPTDVTKCCHSTHCVPAALGTFPHAW